MTATHLCPVCGVEHYPPLPAQTCVCGHPAISHTSDDSRAKHRYCTQWVANPTGDPRRPHHQCGCTNYQAVT